MNDRHEDAHPGTDVRPDANPAPETNPRPEPAPPPAPRIAPLDPPMVPFAIGGLVAWAVIGLALLPFRRQLADHGNESWLWICLAGFLFGIPGLLTMIYHDANRRRRRAAGVKPDHEPPPGDDGGHEAGAFERR